MKKFTEKELLKMSESKINKLFEEGEVDDDTVQHWYDMQDEVDDIAYSFIKKGGTLKPLL